MTTSGYAVLGLLALQPWSAYELARQAGRSLRFAWPKSERHLYQEPKKLVSLGYARRRQEASGPNRTRTIYEITELGRDQLAAWTSTPTAAPAFESETMVRLLFAEHGNLDDLRAALGKLRDDTQELHEWSLAIIDGYASGEDVPFPGRLHLSVLLATFELELFAMIERWADYAIDEISRWGDTGEPGSDDRTELIIRILAARQSILDNPELHDGTTRPVPNS